MFSENLLIENSQWARKNQYFIQNDKNLDSNLLILIESFRSKNSNKTNIIKKGGKVL